MKREGFSLVEILVAVTLAGVLLSSAVVVFRTDGVATSQAARELAANLNRVRFEAIQSNRTAYLAVTTSGAGGYALWVDENDDGARSDGETLTTVRFGSGDLAKVALKVENLPSGGAIRFDRRGVPLDALANTAFTLGGGSKTVTVDLSATGRPTIR